MKKICNDKNILIFDECTTGFTILRRLHKEVGINPDIAILVSTGNGFAITALIEKREIMELLMKLLSAVLFGQKELSNSSFGY